MSRVLVIGDYLDAANASCGQTPIAAGESLTMTFEFRESMASWMPKDLPDTSSGEKYFLKLNEDGGMGSMSVIDITWVEDN